MSINAQAILPGHLGIEAICELFAQADGVNDVHAAPRYRPEHWEVSISTSSVAQIVFDVFLNSWAAEDYSDAWQGPSTFLTCRYQPAALSVLSTLVAVGGGVMRPNETGNWVPSSFLTSS